MTSVPRILWQLGQILGGLVCALAAGGVVAAPAVAYGGAFAPLSRPGPALTPPVAQMAAAMQCSPGIAHARRTPVLLVPGTGASAHANFSWNYEPAFDKLGIPWCAVTFPADGNNDIQINGEYVVFAIRTMYDLAGRRISIVGHSQGGMVPRWALRFWPDTRHMVDDVIGFAGTNHGTTDQNVNDCSQGCEPANVQQAFNSQFIKALNSGQETFSGISYTEIYTHFDEEVRPEQDNDASSALHGGGGMITNVAVQDICPADVVEHLGLGTYDPVAYALTIDALDHPGPADPARIPKSVCAEGLMPGVNPLTFPTDAANALIAVETSPSQTVYREPPLDCYVYANCPSGQRVKVRSHRHHRRHHRRHASTR